MAQPATGPAPAAEGPCSVPPAAPAVDPVVHPADEKPPTSRLVPAALRRIAAMYAGVVTPPPPTGAVSTPSGVTPLPVPVTWPRAGGRTAADFGAMKCVALAAFAGRYVAATGGPSLAPGGRPAPGAVASTVPMPVSGGACLLAAPASRTDLPARAPTVPGPGISAGAPVAVLLNLFFHHLGTRSHAAAALKSS